MKVTVTFTNNNPNTVWNVLARKLGREPTNAEASAEVRRILECHAVDMASRGALPWQKRKR